MRDIVGSAAKCAERRAKHADDIKKFVAARFIKKRGQPRIARSDVEKAATKEALHTENGALRWLEPGARRHGLHRQVAPAGWHLRQGRRERAVPRRLPRACAGVLQLDKARYGCGVGPSFEEAVGVAHFCYRGALPLALVTGAVLVARFAADGGHSLRGSRAGHFERSL